MEYRYSGWFKHDHCFCTLQARAKLFPSQTRVSKNEEVREAEHSVSKLDREDLPGLTVTGEKGMSIATAGPGPGVTIFRHLTGTAVRGLGYESFLSRVGDLLLCVQIQSSRLPRSPPPGPWHPGSFSRLQGVATEQTLFSREGLLGIQLTENFMSTLWIMLVLFGFFPPPGGENPISIMQSGNWRCLSSDNQLLAVRFGWKPSHTMFSYCLFCSCCHFALTFFAVCSK